MKITRIFEWAYGHKLNLSYLSKCSSYHGHNAIVHVEVEGPLNKEGMVMDFSLLKKMIEEVTFDHKNLNDLDYFKDKNPTAENMINFLYDSVDKKYLPNNVKISRIRIYETSKSYAEKEW